jgi:hypothetical protein
MTESEVIESLSELSINASTYMTIFISVTFAYLMVAYFVGRSLSRFQCFAVSALYMLFAAITGASTISWSEAFQLLGARERSIMDEVWLFENASWVIWLVPLFSMVVFTSLYFMYDVRREKTASEE